LERRKKIVKRFSRISIIISEIEIRLFHRKKEKVIKDRSRGNRISKHMNQTRKGEEKEKEEKEEERGKMQ